MLDYRKTVLPSKDQLEYWIRAIYDISNGQEIKIHVANSLEEAHREIINQGYEEWKKLN